MHMFMMISHTSVCFKGSAVKSTQLNGAKAAIPAASVFGSPLASSR
jgi:hypothetical protein